MRENEKKNLCIAVDFNDDNKKNNRDVNNNVKNDE